MSPEQSFVSLLSSFAFIPWSFVSLPSNFVFNPWSFVSIPSNFVCIPCRLAGMARRFVGLREPNAMLLPLAHEHLGRPALDFRFAPSPRSS